MTGMDTTPPDAPPLTVEQFAAQQAARRIRNAAADLRYTADSLDHYAATIEQLPGKASRLSEPYLHEASQAADALTNMLANIKPGTLVSTAAEAEVYRAKGQ